MRTSDTESGAAGGSAARGADAPLVSVIIPAYEAPADLRRCLEALERQTWPADRYEVIVADNGSRADLAEVAAEFPHARCVREEKPGSYVARNRGAGIAQGEVLAFTDSDCIPEGGWIEWGVTALAATTTAGWVAGRVDMFVADPARPTAAELYDVTVLNFRQAENVRERRFGATANLFVRRDVYTAVGPFDERLRSAGDLEWGRRAAARGYAGAYADDARVRHPARCTLVETTRRAARLAAGVWQSRPDRSPLRFLGHLARKLVPAVPFYARVLAAAEPSRFADRAKVVLVALAVKYAEAWALIRFALGGGAERR